MANLPKADVEFWPVTHVANLLKTTEDEVRALSVCHVLPPIRNDEVPLAATVKKYLEHLRDGRRSIKTAGDLIGKSPQWIRHLVAEGYIVKDAEGMVREEDVFLGYIKWLTDDQRRASKVQPSSANARRRL
jgi:hypothetical protein